MAVYGCGSRVGRRAVAPVLLIAAISILISIGGLAPKASAGTRHGCAPRVAVAPRACFPKTITGSFSGGDFDFTWQGTVVLKAHRRQTEYAYRGRAKYTWTLRNTTVGECTLTPASGTIDEPVGVTVGLTRSGKRGYSYSGGNGAGGATGPIKEVCTDGTEDAHNGAIDGAFDPGGFSKNLRTFAGSEPGSSYHFKWSLVGK